MGKNNNYKNVKSNLGRALFKSRFSKPTDSTDKWLHTADLEDTSDWGKIKNLRSVTEQNSLDEFLTTAELAGTEFESEKLNLNFVSVKQSNAVFSKEEVKKIKEIQEQHKSMLRIPRRPFWRATEELDAQAFQAKERESFLEWRRNLALLQQKEHLSMTPFEKNIEFWRQLWRVIERSDVIVQIVDARNPTLFHCEDLEKYVKEVDENKMNLLLVNKSDYLSERQRLEWLRYFESKNIHTVFWSAKLAVDFDLEKIDESNEDQMSERDRKNSHRSRQTTESETSKTNESENDYDYDYDEEDDDDDDDDVEINAKDGLTESEIVNKFKILCDEKSDEEEQEEQIIKNANPIANSNCQETDIDKSETSSDKEEEEEEEEGEEDDEEDKEVIKTPNEELNVVEKTKCVSNTNDLSKKEIQTQIETTLDVEEREKCKILNREELIAHLKKVHKSVDKAKPGITTIGLVGYPNVGKSSTINAMLQDKKVAVSETPGKTKHYQTLYVDDELLLCDCPGLVFPSFVSTRGELIINGILPIDHMRDYVEPINLVLHHIPRNIIEMIYGIEIPKPKEGQDPNRLANAEELCSAYSIFRSYMNHKGTPDVQRSARYILKDYVNGKLLFCYPPPGKDGDLFQDHHYSIIKEAKYLEKAKKVEQKLKDQQPQLTYFDKEFFIKSQPRALTKGGIVGYHRKNQLTERGADLNSSLDSHLNSKPWKKHFNGNKREKLRRKTAHFDQEPYQF